MTRRRIMGRKRSQLVISLGEGKKGEALRALFDRAAMQAGEPITVWARRMLLAAAGGKTELSLAERVERLEECIAELHAPEAH